MADSIREVLLKLGYDDSAVQQGAPRTESALKGIGVQALALGAGFATLGTAVAATVAAIERGQNFNEIANAFKQTGQSVDTLRTATQGLVTDFNLMKQANVADSLGITAKQFEFLASAADTLGDKVGVDTVQALEALTTSFGRGGEAGLKLLKINIDQTAAYEKGAKALGIQASQLNEVGKQELFRLEAQRLITEELKKSAGATDSAGDGLQRLKVSYDNMIDALSSAVEKSPALADALGDIATVAEDLVKNLPSVIEGIGNIGAAALSVVPGLLDAGKALRYLLNAAADSASKSATQKELEFVENRIKSIQNALNSGPVPLGAQGTFDRGRAAQQEKLNELLQKQVELRKAVAEEEKKGAKETEDATSAYDRQIKALKDRIAELLKTGGATEDAKKKAEEYKKAIEQLDQAIALTKFDNLIGGLEKSFEKELSAGNIGALGGIIDQIKEQTREKVIAGLDEGLRDSPQAKEAAALAAEQIGTQLQDSVTEHMQAAFQQSVDFFTDAFYNAMTGAAFDFEDIFKRVLAGFAGQAAASVFGGSLQSLGLGNVTSPQGFGQALFGQIFGAGGATAGGIPGLAGGPPLAGGQIAGGFSIASMGPLVAAAAAALTANAAISGGQRLASGGQLSTQERLLLALPTFGFSEVANFGAGFFGGGADPATLARRNFRGELQKGPLGENLSFRGIRGDISLFDSEFDFSKGRTGLTDQAIGLVNPLAQIFGKGDDKLSADIAGIFADAVDDGKNFNEVLIETASLMKGLGVDVGQAKDELTNLFLDGKVDLDEFTSGLNSLNIIAQDRLPNGLADIGDALAIIGDESATNRAKLKALELAFKALAEAGIDTTSELSAYFSDKFGPEGIAIWEQFAAAGIDTWQEIANASADQIAVIFSILSNSKDEIGSLFSDIGNSAADGFEQGKLRIIKSIQDIKNAAGNISVTTTNGVTVHNLKVGSRGKNAARVDENISNNRNL